MLPPLLKLATSPTMTPTFKKHFYLSSNNLHVLLEMVAILSIILGYLIKQFQGILNLVINSCNVDIVMQICGIMKQYQNVKIAQAQGSTYVVEMAKLNFHYYKIHPNISTNFSLIIMQLIVKIINKTYGHITWCLPLLLLVLS